MVYGSWLDGLTVVFVLLMVAQPAEVDVWPVVMLWALSCAKGFMGMPRRRPMGKSKGNGQKTSKHTTWHEKPTLGFEPRTYALRKHCSTTELSRQDQTNSTGRAPQIQPEFL